MSETLPARPGFSKVVNGRLWINLAADPFVPEKNEKSSVYYHKSGDGWWEFNRASIEDFFADNQQQIKLSGRSLLEIMKGKPSFNSNVIDGLLEHPEFIPEEFKDDKWRFAWHTVIRRWNGELCVRALLWEKRYRETARWVWLYRLLEGPSVDYGFGADDPAIIMVAS